jgi:hypothetical protein
MAQGSREVMTELFARRKQAKKVSLRGGERGRNGWEV